MRVLAVVEDEYGPKSAAHQSLREYASRGDRVTAVRRRARLRAPFKANGVQVLTGDAALFHQLRRKPDLVLLAPGHSEQAARIVQQSGLKVEPLEGAESPSLADKKKGELQELAKQRGLEGYKSLTKDELIERLEEAEEDGVRDDS